MTAIVIALAMGAMDVHAQSTYDKSIKSAENIGAIDNNGFGDSINYYSGALSFQVTDLTIPGNNSLETSVERSYSVEFEHMKAAVPDPDNPLHYALYIPRQYLFGDWDLEIPHISGTFARDVGWQNNSTTPLARCSVIGQVKDDGTPATGEPKKPDEFGPTEFWHGNALYANGTAQVLLLANQSGIPKPTGGPYHWTTNKDWWISCLSQADNATGEAFLAIGPNGTKYKFSWMSTRNVGEMHETVDLGNNKYRDYYTYMDEVMFLPTRITDRFGNWVDYAYSSDAFAKLLSITSSDGRVITFTYNSDGLIESVSDGTQEISYGYTAGPRLSSVTLPDGSSWSYGFASITNLSPTVDWDPEDLCAQPMPPLGAHPTLESYECVGYPQIDGGGSAYVVHPSGARADYLFQTHFHLVDTTGYAVQYPLSIAEKQISGPGLPTRKWSYAFAPNMEAVKSECLAGACPARIWTDEISPEFRVMRRMFGVNPAGQGLLLQELEGYFPTTTSTVTPPITRITRMDRINGDPDIATDATPVTTTVVAELPIFSRGTNYFYRTGPLLGAFPGDYPVMNSQNLYSSARHLPISEKIIKQSNWNFSYKVNQWDAFDRPLSITRESGP